MPVALITLIAAVLALILVGAQLGWRGMGLLLLLCLVVSAGLFTVRTVSVGGRDVDDVHFHIQDRIGKHVTGQKHEADRVQASVASAGVSTEKMWEHLNRSRIDLSEEVPGKDDKADARAVKEKLAAHHADEHPHWVGKAHKPVGNVLRRVVISDPYATSDDCYQALEDGKLREEVNRRLDEFVTDRYRPSLERLGLGPSFIWREVCREVWVEQLDTSVGEMQRVHVLLEFDPSVDRQISRAYRDYERQFRIREVGGFAGLGIGSLALLFGLLKIDTWTKGYYTKRLFFGVPAVIIAITALIAS
ncbi:MAG: hypothetical protein AAGD11_15955 [Planctomycetota bacterium]